VIGIGPIENAREGEGRGKEKSEEIETGTGTEIGSLVRKRFRFVPFLFYF
jgi:hypothetical protein